MRIKIAAVLAAAGAAVALALAPWASASVAARPPAQPKTHVFIVMMENAGFKEVLSPSNANTAYIQHLAATYGLATHYYGVTHTSLPNYLAATSGSTWGSNSDDVTQKTLLDHEDIVDQLQAAHVSWKAYMEGLPHPGFLGDSADYTATPHSSDNALYLLKHDPFLMYPDVYNHPALADKVVPLTELTSDLAHNTVPEFSWITPDICNDMHGMVGPACPYPSSGTGPSAQNYKDGNAFLAHWVPAIMRSKSWTSNSVIFIVWDEGGYSNVSPYGPESIAGCCDSPIIANPPVNTTDASGGDLTGGTLYGGGQVPMIVISGAMHKHATFATPSNHYSLLRTVEDIFHLSYLGYASDSQQVHSLMPLVKP